MESPPKVTFNSSYTAVTEEENRGCCNLNNKIRFIVAFIVYLAGLILSGCSLIFILNDKTLTGIFAGVGIIVGLISTLVLATPMHQYIVWKEKSGPIIAFIIYLIFGIGSVVLSVFIDFLLLNVIIFILQYVVLFAYDISIIDGGISSIVLTFKPSKAVYPEQP